LTFPVQFHLLGRVIPSHLVMEMLGYCVGFQTYLLLRRREIRSLEPAENQVWIIAGAIFGAAIGAKILAIIESFPDYWLYRANPIVWLQGKTIVGGLLGGWIGVECVKRLRHISGSTGDAYVLPLILGVSIGRVGCFLTGLPDHTYGNPTALPWGINFGDGIPRHPTQLYEIAALLLIGVVTLIRQRTPYVRGELFRLFLLLYLCFRFLVEFIKPTFKPYLGLSAIQIASALGAIACWWQIRRPSGLLVRAEGMV
jgi:phosphatidylglycerol---prolipoprotein diacylglyceryl transferase